MPRKPGLRQQINALLDKYDPIIRDAFLAGIAEIRSRITLKQLIERLERRDITGALDGLNLERAAFGRLESAIAQAYGAGGATSAGNFPKLRDATGARIVVRFDARNIRAERWLAEHSANLVTNILSDQREGIRRVLESGMSRGLNPNRVALDIVGRVSRPSGRRTGGLIGLTSQQSEYVDNPRWYLNPDNEPPGLRQQLESGDPKLMRDALNRGRRDKRFDRTIAVAIKDGRPVDRAMISKITGRYSDQLLLLRGETIARTEALTSIHTAKDEGFRQGLDKTDYPPEAVTRVWRTAGDGKVRDTHSSMNGQEVRGLDTPFQSPSGALLKFPGDTSLGAGAAEVVRCRCDTDYRIDFSFGVQ